MQEKGCNCIQSYLKQGMPFEEARKYCTCGNMGYYINQNGDAFPEEDLIASYKTFIGKGLFVNHQSNNVEAIRGIILDAAWIPEEKGVDLLVALDKVAYPEIARQISAGYLNSVSMGVAVQKSICSICGNEAVTESDYCACIKSPNKGRIVNGKRVFEINKGLNFIQISCVSVGADPQAKIRQILASLNTVIQNRKNQIDNVDNISADEIYNLKNEIDTNFASFVHIDEVIDSYYQKMVEFLKSLL